MARDIIERELTRRQAGRARFAVATETDAAEICRLLRENPMPGRISLSLEREPDYFADAHLPDETKQTIVAREGGRIVCAGSCTIRPRFVNGRPRRVGYLGGLRLDASQAGRSDILRRGYAFFQELQADAPADFYFTSIAADNGRARAFLERGLPGMPRYEFIGEFVTVLVPVPRGGQRRAAGSQDAGLSKSLRTPAATEEMVDRLNECNRAYQFAPCWSVEELSALRPLGLQTSDFQSIHEDGCVVASAAIWDQRRFKQTVIRNYTPAMAWSRPVLNLVARLAGGTRLPAIGETLASAFITHLAIEPGKPDAFTRLIGALQSAAAGRSLELLTLGFAANDPRLAVLCKHFRCHEYHSRLYVVHWPECGGTARELDQRLSAPEVASL